MYSLRCISIGTNIIDVSPHVDILVGSGIL